MDIRIILSNMVMNRDSIGIVYIYIYDPSGFMVIYSRFMDKRQRFDDVFMMIHVGLKVMNRDFLGLITNNVIHIAYCFYSNIYNNQPM